MILNTCFVYSTFQTIYRAECGRFICFSMCSLHAVIPFVESRNFKQILLRDSMTWLSVKPSEYAFSLA